MKAIVFYVLSMLSFSLCDIYCPDQSEACECSKDAHECEFTFKVSQRFSFVSYTLDKDQVYRIRCNHSIYSNCLVQPNPCKNVAELSSS